MSSFEGQVSDGSQWLSETFTNPGLAFELLMPLREDLVQTPAIAAYLDPVLWSAIAFGTDPAEALKLLLDAVPCGRPGLSKGVLDYIRLHPELACLLRSKPKP